MANMTSTTGFTDPTTDKTISVVTNFGIGAGVFIFALFLYDILRYFAPGHCYNRANATTNPANNDYDGTPLQSPNLPSALPLSWIWSTLRYSEEKLLKTHGLDVTMYIRFLSTQAKIFLALSIITSIVLIPTYATAESPDLDSLRDGIQGPSGIERASLANVADMSPRLWVTLVSEIAVVFIILMFLYYDLVAYTMYRRKYRADNIQNPSNFAILIMDIPPESREEAAIYRVFESIFPGQVCAVHPVRDAHHLLALKTRYVTCVNKRQRAQYSAVAKKTPVENASDAGDEPSSPPATSTPSNNQTDEDEVVARRDIPIASLNDLQPSSVPSSQASITGFVSDELLQSTNLTRAPDDILERGGRVMFAEEVNSERPNNSLIARDTSDIQPIEMPSTIRPRSTLRLSERFQASPRLRALTRVIFDQIVEMERLETKARDVVVEVEKSIDQSAPITHAAFVVFQSKVTTTCAVTAPIWPTIGTFKVQRAPDPRAINWDRINITRYTTRIRQYLSFGVLTTLTLLWTVPSGFIQALGNLEVLGNTLEKKIPFIKEFADNNQQLAKFLEGILPPLLLFLVLLLIPFVMRFIISFERIPSKVQVEARVRNFLFFFYVMSNFVYQVAIGSFLNSLQLILENPRELVTFLSTSVPTQATFLMKYVLINSFLGSTFGMLNTGRLLFRPLIMWRVRTERDKMQGDKLFAAYPFAKMYALCMMISLISYVYATIAPIMNLVALLYFSIAYLCTKQILLYSHQPMYEGGGYMFRDAWTGLLIGLYVHQLSMIGIFILKRAAPQVILAILSLLFSIWFTLYCRRRFLYRVEHGTLVDQTHQDDHDEEEVSYDAIPSHFSDMYVHPGLKPVEMLEDITVDLAKAPAQRQAKVPDIAITPPASLDLPW